MAKRKVWLLVWYARSDFDSQLIGVYASEGAAGAAAKRLKILEDYSIEAYEVEG